MTKFMKMQIIWSSVVFVLILIIGFLGVYALQKSMTIKMGFNVEPNIRCEIWMHTNADGQVGGEDVYNKIFCNKSGEEYIATNVLLNETTGTLTLPNNFRGGIGAGFDLKIYNYTTNTPIFVSSQGEGVSLHSVICAGYVSGTPTPQILSVSSVLGTANIVFETEFYQVSFNNPALSFDNANSSVAEFDGHYYISAGLQLTGTVISEIPIELDTIQINTTTYNSTQIAGWLTNTNVLTIPNDIDGTITINVITYYKVSFNNNALTFSSSNTVQYNNNYFIRTGQQLVGTIIFDSDFPLEIFSIVIGETPYAITDDSPIVSTWLSNTNVLTIPNNITINGDITINATIYSALSYLESSGTQYIDTLYKDTNTLTVDCKFQIISLGSVGNYLFGAQQTPGSMMRNGLYVFPNGDIRVMYADIFVDFPDSYSIVMTQRVSGTNITMVINNSTYSGVLSTLNTGTNIYIFACRHTDGNFRPYTASLKCYYFKMLNNNVLVRDYVPMLRTNDNKPGMWDRLNNMFYTNPGTGEFLYG